MHIKSPDRATYASPGRGPLLVKPYPALAEEGRQRSSPGALLSDNISSENKDKPSPDSAGWRAIVAPSLSFEMEIPYKLSKGVGRKRVFGRFMDAAGNVSNMRDDRIMFRRR